MEKKLRGGKKEIFCVRPKRDREMDLGGQRGEQAKLPCTSKKKNPRKRADTVPKL